jgi:scyllo-inositol 2-dehydrogenase (NADP+)
MLRTAIIGLGKMGLSHQSMVNAHPEIDLKAVCDTSSYVLDVLSKYTGVQTYTDHRKLLADQALDCIFVATPSRYHAEIVESALEKGLHVFCEKPFALDPATGFRLADMAERKKLINQVGYHYRFVAAFAEAKRLLDQNIIGELHHLRAQAYGPVVLRPKGSTWRSQKSEGGGCLYDYACHAVDLLNYLVGRPISVSGSVMNGVFSSDVDDEIYSTLQFSKGFYGQLATNWSDESYRKMSVKIDLWGSNGRISVDRQEVQVFLRTVPRGIEGYAPGWNVRYTTDLTPPVWFYVRGEEYSAQIDHFVQCIKTGVPAISSFRSASDASLVAAMVREDAAKPRTAVARTATNAHAAKTIELKPQGGRSFMRALFDRL